MNRRISVLYSSGDSSTAPRRGEEVDADEGDPDPGVDDDALVEDAVEHVSPRLPSVAC